MTHSNGRSEEGYILIGFLILLAISALVVATAVDISSTNTRTVRSVREHSKNYYSSEESLNRSVQWMRDNSTGLAMVFSRSNFYTAFDRSTPSAGSNEGSILSVPTKLKLQGTTHSAFLSSASELGSSDFPPSTDSITGISFDSETGFSSASLGDSEARITLVDALAVDPTKDYGDPDNGNSAPDTDFQPVYRVDAMNSGAEGSHLLGYLIGTLVMDYGIGFYGRDLLELRQPCDSYLSNSGAYSSTTKRANCAVGSDGTLQIHGQESVYGAARTDGAINTSSPFGGGVCADFQSGCPNPGVTCEGASCNVPGLPTYSTWATYCSTNQGDLTISSSQTKSVAGNNASQKCWNSITINNNKVLTLDTTTYPYFIDTFDIPNTGRVNFSPSPATGTINLYVRKFTGDKFNGNQVFNTNNKPYQLRIHYLGTDDLTLNGTAAMNAFIVAPYAAVNVQGNFTMSGGIKAESLVATGSGDLHYDESGDITTISDTTYRLVNMEEYHR